MPSRFSFRSYPPFFLRRLFLLLLLKYCVSHNYYLHGTRCFPLTTLVSIEPSSSPFSFTLSSSLFSILMAAIMQRRCLVSSRPSLSSPVPDSSSEESSPFAPPPPASSLPAPFSPALPPLPSSFCSPLFNATRSRNECQPPYLCTVARGLHPFTYVFRSHEAS
jgi:hypothetical protein